MTTVAALEGTEKTLLAGIDEGLHIGAQVHVRHAGGIAGDIAVGEARAGVAMTPDTSMIWFSSTKAVTSVAWAIAWERGGFGLDDRVADHLPDFGANGKDTVTIRHVLTHTGGFRLAGAAGGGVLRDMDEAWPDICAAPLEEGWRPGRKAGYHPTSGMAVLAKLVETADPRPFRQFVREEIFEPLGMDDCWIGMPADRHEAYGEHIGVMHDTSGDGPRPLPNVDSSASAALCIPGGGGRGPMRQLGRFYEMLRGHGELDGTRIVTPQTVAALSARHRTGMHDETFGIVIDWGLGFIVDSAIYGRHSSPRTFGHGGARSSVGFHDPEADLVVTAVFNGMAERSRHYRRLGAVCDAIYGDLGLADPGGGRDRATPGGNFL